MTIADMVSILHARVLRGEKGLNRPVHKVCCSDLMSDVLAFVNDKTVLVTGLCNQHVVRTSEMLDLKCLVFVRGKIPGDDILDAADELGMTVLATRETAFTTCGLLYAAGLRGEEIDWPENGEATSNA